MNDTTVIGASAASEEDVRDYVDAVRAWLGDLPPDEVDDLTAGMEADLTERAFESGARLGDLLGQPEEYAAELRAAAGLPPRAAPGASPPRRGVVADLATALGASGRRTLDRWPWLRELRPTWWLARGWVLGCVVAQVFGTGRAVLLPLLGAALSFWVGRRLALRGAPSAGGRTLALVNVVAVLALLPAAIWYLDTPAEGGDGPGPLPGVSLDGGPVSNLYVYDATGAPVDGARIFTQEGAPLTLDPEVVPPLVGPEGEAVVWPPDHSTLSVFPLRSGSDDPWTPHDPVWMPPSSIAPLAGAPSVTPSASPPAEASPSPSATATSTGGPSGTPTPSPTASP